MNEGFEAPAILAEAVSKRYGSFTAVDRLEPSVRRGEVFCPLRPNGSGEASLLRLSAGTNTMLEEDTPTVLAAGESREGGGLPLSPAARHPIMRRANIRGERKKPAAGAAFFPEEKLRVVRPTAETADLEAWFLSVT